MSAWELHHLINRWLMTAALVVGLCVLVAFSARIWSQIIVGLVDPHAAHCERPEDRARACIR